MPRSAPGLRAWPNPARGVTDVQFELAEAQALDVLVFDVAGRLARDVQSGAMAPGSHDVPWDGRDASGRRVASGVYFLRVESRAHAWIARVAEIDCLAPAAPPAPRGPAATRATRGPRR
jgi:hypothetical protein